MKDKTLYMVYFPRGVNQTGKFGGVAHSLRKAKKLQDYLSSLACEGATITTIKESKFRELLRNEVRDND